MELVAAQLTSMKIFLALSGGVDSAVAALLLKNDGHEVIGCFMQSRYCAADDRRDALRVAAALDIPLVTLDVADAYDEDVIRPMLDGYVSGSTPNPDVDCNALIKFPLLWQEAKRIGADAIATGHYARTTKDVMVRQAHHDDRDVTLSLTKGDHQLFCSTDSIKDQTYFLYRLTHDDLSHTYFPIGHLTKPEVRRIAREVGLPVADKRSTRGVCFVGEVKMKDFIDASPHPNPLPRGGGDVVAMDGHVLGVHGGVQLYTIGQRAPVGGAERPWYVVSKQPETNTLVVAAEDDPVRCRSAATVTDVHWVSGRQPEITNLTAKIRSRGNFITIRCHPERSEGSLKVFFGIPQPSLAPGQHIVFYDADACLGGGVIV